MPIVQRSGEKLSCMGQSFTGIKSVLIWSGLWWLKMHVVDVITKNSKHRGKWIKNKTWENIYLTQRKQHEKKKQRKIHETSNELQNGRCKPDHSNLRTEPQNTGRKKLTKWKEKWTIQKLQWKMSLSLSTTDNTARQKTSKDRDDERTLSTNFKSQQWSDKQPNLKNR